MADFKIPGPMGIGINLHIDAGTLSRVASSLPGPVGFDQPILDYLQREIRRGIRRGLYRVSEIAYNTAVRQLEALEDDIVAKMRYIASLPDELQKVMWYELYAAGFSHYLPKKFLQHYIWGHGATMTLTLQEMVDCNPIVDMRNSKDFNSVLSAALVQRGKPVPFQFNIRSIALTNGTLGQFTTRAKGTLIATSAATWQATGEMTFYDIYDFDAKDFKTGGRTVQGEIKTRIGSLLPGKAFTVDSESTKFTQRESDRTVVWAGGTPTLIPDRISEADASASRG